MTAHARHRAAARPRAPHERPTTEPPRRATARRALVALGLGILAVSYAAPQFTAHPETAGVSAGAAPGPEPSTYGVLTGADTPLRLRWSWTAEDLLDTAVTAPHLEVIDAGPAAAPAGPLLTLAGGVVGSGASGYATARVVAVDAGSGAVRWRGPTLGDVPECAAAADLVACAERTADAGRVVLLDPRDGRELGRVAVPGRATHVSVDNGTAYVVSATPQDGATRLDLTRLDADRVAATGAVTWTHTELAPLGSVPGPILTGPSAVGVTEVSVQGREFLVAAGDGSPLADRRPGAALSPGDGRRPVRTGQGRFVALPGGAPLTGNPVRPAARDGATPIPLLAMRYGEGAAGELVGYADPASGRPTWTVPGARPLAACAGRLVVAIAPSGGSGGAAATDASADSEVAALDPATGAIAWRTPLAGRPPTSAACTAGTVLTSRAGGSGGVSATRLVDGAQAWSSAPTGPAPADTEPARLTARGEALLVATRRSGLARLDCLGPT